ncbi:hypothetical protein PIIN_04190 [Serendipita indica DSM 11827]|uniref:DUF6533 domain-containing protein n=1 Tax=Serendipita indica (strain DSM 11827) TaxID=1109443 RepID=G4TG02_SERID|nr:hypothetical protein PIIN_04190 [Serendipita indica DSM 11827]
MSFALQQFFKDFYNIRVSSYTCGAGMVVLLYDFVLTFPEEIKYIWSGKQTFNAVKLMFLWNRYLVVPWIVVSNFHIAAIRGPLTDTCKVRSVTGILMRRSCRIFIPANALIQGISIIVGIQLLALRVLALYRNNIRVRLALYAYLGVCHSILFVLVGISMSRFVPYLKYLDSIQSCYTIPDPLIKVIYIPPLAAETGIMLLQIFNHFQRRKEHNLLRTRLMSTLFRDGYLWYITVLSVRLLCILVYEFAPLSLWFVGNQLEWPLSTALISRFFLQLRGAIDEEQAMFLPGPDTAGSLGFVRGKHQHSSPGVDSVPARAYPTFNPNQREVYIDESPLPLQELRRMRIGNTQHLAKV